MKKTIESKEIFEWDITDGVAVAAITGTNNGYVLKSFKAGKTEVDSVLVNIESEETLREIHKAMGQLIQEIDKKRGVGRSVNDMITDKATQHIYDNIGGEEITRTFTSGHDSIQ